ncbi:MAG TPA: hypothetical protein VGT79_00005, partial [Xanthomonadaceae bacterium]|nr:hypothetical protein [Xanthomonadaceae bacterium]
MSNPTHWWTRAMQRKWWILLALIVLCAVVFGVHAAEHALFQALRAALGTLHAAVDLAPTQMIVIYFLLYV